jgi:hypothetical protein
MDSIFGQLYLPEIRESVEFWSSTAVTNAVKTRQNDRRYLGTKLLTEIDGVRCRCGSCEKSDVKVDIWLGGNQRGQISWQGDMRSVVRCSEDHRVVIAAFFLCNNCPNVIRGPFYANYLV